MDGGDLDVYEIAWLCGGAQRVAQVALVALSGDGRIKISPARHRVSAVRRHARDPVEAAALEAIPGTGRPLRPTLTLVAASPAVQEIAAGLRRKGLRTSRLRPWSTRPRRLRRRFSKDPGDGLLRVAVLGPAGIEDGPLRRTFETPDPERAEPPKLYRGPRAGHAGRGADGRLNRPDDYDDGGAAGFASCGSGGGGPD